MFLVPFNKKSILDDSTLPSQQQEEQQPKQQVRTIESETNSSFYGIDEPINVSQGCNKSSTGFNEQGILTHNIDRSLTFLERYLIKSVATLKRWLKISLQALLAIVDPFLSNLFFAVSSFSTSILLIFRLPKIEEPQVSINNQLTWEAPPAISFATELEHLHALLISKRQQQIHECFAGGRAGKVSSSEHITLSDQFVESQTRIDCTNHSDSMDFCRRRSSRPAASNNTANGSDLFTNASLSPYWNQFLPTALAQIATGTSDSDASRALDAQIEPLAVATSATGIKQSTHIDVIEFEGQQQQPQPRRRRSCGLQIDASNVSSASGGMRESGGYLLEQKQQHQLQRVSELQQQQDIQTPPLRTSKQHSHCAPPDLMSALHSLQQQQQQNQHKLRLPEREKQQKENNNNNNAMNFNAHTHFIHHQSQQNQSNQLLHCPSLKQNNGDVEERLEAGGNGETSMVLVSKSALSNLTDQIAFSMNKMKHLEEQVRVIPELQRRLDHVLVTQDDDGEATQFQAQKQQMQSDYSARFNSFYTASNLYKGSHHHGFSASNQGSLVNNGALRRRSNTNIGSDELSATRAIHPSLQRHYNSFRQYSTTNKTSADVHQQSPQRDVISYRRSPATTTNRLSTRSPTAASRICRDYNGAPQHAQVFEHLNDRFGSGATISSSSLSPLHLYSSPKQQSTVCRSNNDDNDHHHHRHSINGADSGDVGSPHKAEYQELINDLISLSYSVNYQSTSKSNSVQSSGSSSREKKPRGISKTAESSPLHQVPINRGHSPAHQHETLPSQAITASSSISNGSRRHFNTNPMGTTKLDCGCQSFKEHLRYNSISREQRLNNHNQHINNYHARSRSSSATTINPVPVISPHHQPQKADASTNTELSMDDIVTKVELDNMVTSMQKTYSTLSSIASRDNDSIQFKSIVLSHNHKSAAATTTNQLSSTSPTSSVGSFTDPKSSTTPPGSSSIRSSNNSCGDDEAVGSECSSNKGIVDEDEIRKSSLSNEGDGEDDSDTDDEERANEEDARSPSCGEPYSLGSSYQDPSDFEEYCAYGESLDRRTKDFMSQTTKIPNDLRFALIRLNDYIKKKHSFEQIETSSGCVDVVRKEWFKVAANNDSLATKTKLYVDYFESFTKQLLNSVVNLTDSAGNTAMHYAASHNKLDIIRVLLDTKVCDINRRNKAGYTAIMLLALADIVEPAEQEVARHLFSLGDVNIKARTSGQTAIMLAASHGRTATVRLLLECGADPSMQDYDGSTALMCGSEMGHEEVVKLLLAHKLTDPNETDNDGLDALTIAMNNGHKSIGLMLYAAKNVPRMVRSTMSAMSNNNDNSSLSNQTFVYQTSLIGNSGYLGASLRRSRAKLATNYVKRADSLLGSRSNGVRPLIRQFVES